MKKFAAMFLLVLTMALFAGCSKEEAPMVARSYDAEAGITQVKLEVRDRAIRVMASEDEAIHIDYFDSEKEFYEIAVTDGCLTMTAAVNKELEDYVGTNAPKEERIIKVYLPQGVDLDLATTNEDISLDALTAGDAVTLTNNGGNITFDTLSVGSALTLDVKNGNIEGKLLGGYDDFTISCTIKKGDTNLPESKLGGDKTLTVNVNNGDVNIELQK